MEYLAETFFWWSPLDGYPSGSRSRLLFCCLVVHMHCGSRKRPISSVITARNTLIVARTKAFGETWCFPVASGCPALTKLHSDRSSVAQANFTMRKNLSWNSVKPKQTCELAFMEDITRNVLRLQGPSKPKQEITGQEDLREQRKSR